MNEHISKFIAGLAATAHSIKAMLVYDSRAGSAYIVAVDNSYQSNVATVCAFCLTAKTDYRVIREGESLAAEVADGSVRTYICRDCAMTVSTAQAGGMQ